MSEVTTRTSVPAGWYPDPVSPGVARWWTGVAWSEHRAPAVAPAPMPVVVVAAPPAGPNHLIHLILTLVSCGLWAPIWLLITIAARTDGHGKTVPRWMGPVAVAACVAVGFLSAWSSTFGAS